MKISALTNAIFQTKKNRGGTRERKKEITVEEQGWERGPRASLPGNGGNIRYSFPLGSSGGRIEEEKRSNHLYDAN
jgi:hypothetical protein